MFQKLFLQAGNFGQRIAVRLTINIVNCSFLLAVLNLLHSLFFQRNQLIRQGGHAVDHALFFCRNSDLLHSSYAQIPVL